MTRLALVRFMLFAAPHVLAGAFPPAAAQESGRAIVAPTIEVEGETESATGPVQGYRATRSATATKTDTPILETPQAITVVTRERIEDQGATSLQDALNYAAGVRSDAYGLDSRTDSVSVRGGYPVEYRDGLRRQLTGFYTSTSRVDPYTLERIEVLRGPAAMLYGQGSTAGVINMVSKRPQDTAYREIGLQLGNYGRKQVQTDLTGPLDEDGEFLYRIVTLGRDADTQVDFVQDDRALFAPSLTWRPSTDTSLTLQFQWQRDRTGSTLQFLPWSGTVLPNPNGEIPTSRFLGEPGFDHYDTDRVEAGWLFEHRIDDRWTVRQNTRYSRNEVDYQTFFPDVYSNPNSPYTDPNQRVLDRFAYIDQRDVRLFTADQHLQGKLDTGPVRHQFLLGWETVRHRETAQGAFDLPVSMGGTAPPIDAYAPVYPGYTPSALTNEPRSLLTQDGIYLQDQMKIGPHWIVVAGMRYDRSINRVEGADKETDSAVTRRGGLMYRFDSGLAPYLSYSESFTPVAGTNLFGTRFKPLRGEQIEAGVKWQPPGRRLMLSAAVYELEEQNRKVTDPANPLNEIQTGMTRNRGLELEAVGQVLSWLDIAAHYNYIDVDEQLEIIPEHQFAVWSTSRFQIANTPGYFAGFGMRYMSSFRDGSAPVTPQVTLVDASLGFDDGSWRYALNVQNLTDETYFSTCLARGDCFYGARRTVSGSATYRF